MKQEFENATRVLEIINKNKQLTVENYSEQESEILAKKILNEIYPYIQENLSVYENWDKQNYDQRFFYTTITTLFLSLFH